jgi:putative sugar O-methyltransferase
MDEHDRAMIRSIKKKIIAMLEERQSLVDSNTKIVSPSKLWSFGLSNSDYMLGLSEESFAKLRLHTYHFTADVHLNYWGDPQEFRVRLGVDTTSKDIPPKYIINELEGGIGYHYSDGRFISNDSLRFQNNINTLYRQGILKALAEKRKSYILEIGAGYGGLLHHLSNILGNTTCVIVDIPETLLFSASYLSMHNPKKKIYIYEPSNFSKFINSEEAKSYDFILVPNYRFELLNNWRFDLIINITSMQEMRTEQVETYLDFISKTCAGVFYSFNLDCYITNTELTSLSDLLKARFELTEISPPTPQVKQSFRMKLLLFLSALARSIHLLEKPAKTAEIDTRYTIAREYICKPKQT